MSELNFQIALETVLLHEGGFVQHPADYGHATKFGISMATLAHYLKRPVSVSDVQNLTPEIATQIYHDLYWSVMKLDLIDDPKLCTIVFDMGVLQGAANGVRLLQSVCQVPIDGVMGLNTARYVNQYEHPTILAVKFLMKAEDRLVKLVVDNPSQIVFLQGWIARIHDLMRSLFEVGNPEEHA